MASTLNIKIMEVHALAGVFAHEPSDYENPLLVLETHSRTKDCTDGCGALGHLNPHHADRGVEELFSGLKAHGIDAEAYFGMDEKGLAQAVKSIGFETDSHVRAARLLEEAKAHGIPAVCASFGHEDGSITIVGTWGLDRIDLQKPIDVSGAVCADARVPSESVAAAARCALENRKTCSYPELIPKNPKVQSPSEILVYGKGTIVPDNKAGDVFRVAVDPQKGVDILAKVSLAYAIANFGPSGNGPKSVVRIRLHGVGDKAASQLKEHLSCAKGIIIV